MIEPLAHDFDTQAQIDDLTDKVNEIVDTVNLMIDVLPKKGKHPEDVTTNKIKELADRLVETLGNMEPEKADAIVHDVATSLYTDVLGLKGCIKCTSYARMCDDFGTKAYGDYEFVEDKGATNEKNPNAI